MHPNALVALAAELLGEVMNWQAAADGVVAQFARRHRNLGPRERHTLAETAYAVLRRRRLFEHLALDGTGPMARRLAMLGWQGDAGFLQAALTPHEQAWLARAQAIDRSTLQPACRHNLPDWLAATLVQALGESDFWSLAAALLEPAPLDLRVNSLKARREDVRAALAVDGIDSQPSRFSPWGLRVRGKPALARSPSFELGQVEVQDEGSQLLALLTDARRGEMVVDFCAGGGGKTLALGAAMRNTGRLYAFDVSGHRLEGLKARVVRSGLSNVHPAQIAHERDERLDRLAGKVDRVLVDAPCSGLGTLRRNPDLKWRQAPASISALAIKQIAILKSAGRLLKPGGRLVYATCSLLEAENEEVAEAFTGAHAEFRPVAAGDVLRMRQVEAAAELVDGLHLRLWPHRHQTDGFFAAVWERL